MAINERLIHTAAAAGATNAEQNLILHLDANDVDSYDGDGSVWYDISEHDVTVPLTDNDDNLKIHINASDPSSYGGSGSTVTDLKGNGDFTLNGNASFDKDNGGYFTLDGTGDGVKKSTATTGFDGDFTLEFWYNLNELTNLTYFFGRNLSSDTTITGLYLGNAGSSARVMEIYRKPADGGALSSTTVTWTSALTTNKWHHMVVVFEDQKVKCYLDGELNVTSSNFMTDSAGYYDSYGSIELGTYTSSSYELSGELGAFRFYEEALSASEIGQNYRHGRDYIYTDLIDTREDFTEGTVTSGFEIELDANDYSGSGNWLNTGDATGGDATITGATYNNDESSDFFSFDGSSDYATLTSDGVKISSSGSVEFWIKPDNTSQTNKYIVSQNSNNNNWGYAIRQNGADIYMWSYQMTPSQSYVSQITASSVLTANKWHHVVVTIGDTASKNKIYVDNVLKVTEDSLTGTLQSNSNTLYIGTYYPSAVSTTGWAGDLAQLRIYDSILSASNIETNYDATKGLYQNADLKLHLDAGDFPQKGETNYSNTPTTWEDKTSNSYDGTISGAVFDSELGNWLDFDGVDDVVTTTYDIPSSGAKTIEIWFNAASTQNDTYCGVIGGDNEVLWIGGNLTSTYSDESIYWYQNPSELGLVIRDGEGEYFDDKWHHLAIVDTGSAHKMYLDGQEKSFTYAYGSGSTRLSADNVMLGKGYNNDFMTGKIGQFRIYSSALTADQVMQNYLYTKNHYPNGKHATLTSATWASEGSFSFQNNQYATIPVGAFVGDNNQIKTITAWVKPDTTTSRVFPYTISSSTSGEYYFTFGIYNDSSKVYVSCRNGNSSNQFQDNFSITPDTNWHHIAVTFDGTTRRLYFDGDLQTSSVDNRGTATSSSWISYSNYGSSPKAYIGRGRHVSSWYSDGKVSDVKFFDTALTDDEIEADFNKGQFGEN
jgi:hypothetical protein